MALRLSPLDFLGCEATHDNLFTETQLVSWGMLPLVNDIASHCNLNQGINIMNTRRLGTLAHGEDPAALFPDSYFTAGEVVDQEQMVELMFGANKATLKAGLLADPAGQPANSWHNVQVQQINEVDPVPPAVIQTRTVGPSPVTIKLWAWNPTDPLIESTTWGNIFRHVNNSTYSGNNSKHVYLVSDSASHFIGRLSSNNDLPGNTHIHCMFSTASYGDPCSLVTPDSTNMILPIMSINCNKFVHEFITPINSLQCDKLTMLDMTIGHTLNPGHVVDAHHRYPIVGLDIHYADSRAGTTKPAIKTRINSEGTPSGKFRAAQGKRLGDHNQIRFAKLLQNYNGTDAFSTNITSSHVNNAASPGRTPIPAQALSCNTNNVFFVTQDWPAFCFAVFNKINSILVTVAPKGFIVAHSY